MDKKSLNIVSELVSFDAIPKAKKDEKLADYVQRAYPSFEKAVSKSENPIVNEIESDSADELRNAISKLSVRRQLIENFCKVNDPFELEPPKNPTTQDILDHNGIQGSEKDLRKVMGDDGFDKMIAKLKTPKKDGITQTEANRLREEHYAKYEPVMPSEKEYTHASGGTTREYHWQSSLQEEFIKDHAKFLKKYKLSDSFPQEEEESTDKEAEKSDK